MGKILRRTFLVGSAAVVGGVAVGYWQVTKPYANPLLSRLKDGESALTPYVIVASDGITIVAPRAEMGQGVKTTLAALVAEELDVDLNEIKIINGPASKAYYNSLVMEEAAGKAATDTSASAERLRDATKIIAKIMGGQSTGGSTSTPDAFEKMRAAGAAARIVLIEAAAVSLGVPAANLNTENGKVIAPDGSSIPYTDLGEAAAAIMPPSNPPLRQRSDWQYLGKSLGRVDMVEKCTGTAQYAIDVRLPGMAYAAVRVNNHLGAGVKSYDASKAEARGNFKNIVPVKNGLAVVSTNTWNAFQAAKDIEIEWAPAPYPTEHADIVESHRAAFSDKPDSQKRNDGDVIAVLADGDIVEAEYHVPYLAHATMEPMNAVAHLYQGKLDVWVGTQTPTRCLDVAKEITGLKEENINIHSMYLGGGFGRRSEIDFVEQAIEVAKAMEGTPIKLTWSREEDMAHDMYRPLTLARFRGAVRNGKPAAFDMHVSASAAALDAFERRGMKLNMADPTIIQNAWDNPYRIENYRVTGYRAKKALPVGFWRSVGASQNAFFQECATDELAHAANADPLQFRLDMLGHEPSRKVLEAVAELSGWGDTLPEGRARGIAYYLSFGAPVAEVIEIVETKAGIKVDKVFVAADVGLALDPRNVEAQLQSGVIYGLTAAIQGEITVENGAVKQRNFNDYDAMRMYQAPSIDVRILENGPHITGVGEPGTPPAAPALANAIFALNGKRIRELPLNNSVNFI